MRWWMAMERVSFFGVFDHYSLYCVFFKQIFPAVAISPARRARTEPLARSEYTQHHHEQCTARLSLTVYTDPARAQRLPSLES